MHQREIQVLEKRLCSAYSILRNSSDNTLVLYSWSTKNNVCIATQIETPNREYVLKETKIQENGTVLGSSSPVYYGVDNGYYTLQLAVGRAYSQTAIDMFFKKTLLERQNSYLYKSTESPIVDLLHTSELYFYIETSIVNKYPRDLNEVRCELTANVFEYTDDGYVLLGREIVSEYFVGIDSAKGLYKPNKIINIQLFVDSILCYLCEIHPEITDLEKTFVDLGYLMELKTYKDCLYYEYDTRQVLTYLTHVLKEPYIDSIDALSEVSMRFCVVIADKVYISYIKN